MKLIIGLASILASMSAAEAGLIQELTLLAHERGLAVVSFGNTTMEILRFDGQVISRPLRGDAVFSVVVGDDGTSAMIRTSSGVSHIVANTGEEEWAFPPVPGIRAASLFRGRDRVAFILHQSNRRNAGLYYVIKGRGIALAVELEEADILSQNGLGWSPSGDKIVYGQKHHLMLFDLATGSSSVLTEGDSPTWSPDGRRIAYERPDHSIGLFNPLSRESLRLAVDRGSAPLARWSPDSRYILVGITHRGPSSRGCFSNERLAIVRISDGAVLEVFDPCGVRTMFFYWVEEVDRWHL